MLEAIAVTKGAQRYLAFQQQVKAYHDEWKAWFAPRILEGIAIQQQDLAQLPTWQWREVTGVHTPLRLLQLTFMAVLLLTLALRKLRRFPVV